MKIKIFSVFMILCPFFSYAADISVGLSSDTAHITQNNDTINQQSAVLKYKYEHDLSVQSSISWVQNRYHNNGITGQVGFVKSVSDDADIAVNIGTSNKLSDYLSRYYVNARLEYYIDDAVSVAPIYKEYHFTNHAPLYQAAMRTTLQNSFADYDMISYLTPIIQNQSDSLNMAIDMGTGFFTHHYGGYGVSFVAGQGTYQSNMLTYFSDSGGYYGIKPKFSYPVTANMDMNLTTDIIKLTDYSVYAGGLNFLYHF